MLPALYDRAPHRSKEKHMSAESAKNSAAPWMETWDTWMRTMYPMLPPRPDATLGSSPATSPWPFPTPFQVAEFWMDVWLRWFQLVSGSTTRSTPTATGLHSVVPTPAAWDAWMDAWQRTWQLYSPQVAAAKAEKPAPRPEARGRQ
jgi:hypothetical protein